MIKRLIKLGISIAFWIADSGKKSIMKRLGYTLPGTCIILYYHVVTKEQLPKFLRQMDILLRLAQPISLDKVPHLKERERYVSVTFDDGFQETLKNVLPGLLKRNIPLTIFIPTGCLGLEPHWLNGKQRRDRGGIILTADEVRKLSRNILVSFGSHCVTHRPLTSLTDEEAKNEIFRSKAELEKILGRNVQMLSFPHGANNEKHIKWAREAGYVRVFSILPTYGFLESGEFITGRVRADPEDWPLEFRLKILGAYRWLLIPLFIKRKIEQLYE